MSAVSGAERSTEPPGRGQVEVRVRASISTPSRLLEADPGRGHRRDDLVDRPLRAGTQTAGRRMSTPAGAAAGRRTRSTSRRVRRGRHPSPPTSVASRNAVTAGPELGVGADQVGEHGLHRRVDFLRLGRPSRHGRPHPRRPAGPGCSRGRAPRGGRGRRSRSRSGRS